MTYELKDYLKAINVTKEPLLDSEDQMWEKKFSPFIINKCLAPFEDTIMLVNEVNQLHQLDKKVLCVDTTEHRREIIKLIKLKINN